MARFTQPGGQAPSISNHSRSNDGKALAVCAVLSIALFTVSVRMGDSGPLSVVRGAFQTITTPVRYLGAAVSSPFQGLGNVFANLTADQATLTELQAENEELRARNVELEEAESDVERLQGLLELQSAYNLQSTAARIIGGSTDSWSSTVTIDKGSSSGLTVGMPVTASGGVVGQIVECSASSSVVRLLSDESSSVSALDQTTRAQGMLKGSATGQVELTLVRTSQTINVGDVIITSGLGGVYPKGLPIGEVTSVEAATGAVYYTVVVEPYVNAENNTEVLVITSLTEDQRATAEDISEADAQETSTSSGSDDSSADDASSEDGVSDDGASDSADSTDSGDASAADATQ